MKQVNFLVEVAIDPNGDTTIIIRSAMNGQIMKVTKDPSDVTSFLSQGIESLKAGSAVNTPGHE